MCADYRDKSRNTDFEQHANKIFTAIREIKPEYAEKRAIWELFQNALDIVDDKGVIRITKTNKGFKFEHNGRPFTDGNLTGLIKQSSNGKTYGSNKNEIGQYGTGFLSTHVYGKQIHVNGSVNTDDNGIKELNDFLIDRRANNPKELLLKIQQQDDLAALICDGDGNRLDRHLQYTSFEYTASIDSRINIENMLEYVHAVLPLIFVFNRKLYKVEIDNDRVKRVYTRGDETNCSLKISTESGELQIYYLEDPENELKVVLPQVNLQLKELPKLFLFYPLMETQFMGVQFITHAQEFKPNRERDFLFLDSSNPEVQHDIALNKKLLDSAFELVINKAVADEGVDFLSLIEVSYSVGENEYLRQKKAAFINDIKGLKRIPISDGKLVSLNSIHYLHVDLLSLDEEKLRSIYGTLLQFYDLPEFNLYKSLSIKVDGWKDNEFNVIGYEEIVQEIYQSTQGNYRNIIDKEGYQTLVQVLNVKTEKLSKLKVVPNIHSELRTTNELKKCADLEVELIEIVDCINANVSQHFMHSDFNFLDTVSSYDRESFKDDLNKFNGICIGEIEKGYLLNDSVRFWSLIRGLCNYILLNKSTDINQRLGNFLTSEYKLEVTTSFISSPSVTLQYDSSFKLLARLHVMNLKSKPTDEIIESIEDLKSFVSILHQSGELRKNLLDKLECYPNQEYLLQSQQPLKHDLIGDEAFKDLHDNYADASVRELLIPSQFGPFVEHSNSLTGENLGGMIEEKIHPQKIFNPANPKMLPTLIELVSRIANNDRWQLWLPNIAKVKNEVMLAKFKDEETSSSLFKILSGDDEQIKTLGELSSISDLKQLIQAGREKQKEERRKKQHLDYIHKVGIQIQNLIKDQLDASLAETIEIVESTTDEKLTNKEEQNGQDFIIYKSGIAFYYIEVKSRWDTDGIVALSKRQVERCSQNIDNYAVITVNVADYKSRNGTVQDDISFEELNEDIYVNLDLGENFKELIQTNIEYESIKANTKLIDLRGHIPQERIRNTSVDFTTFIIKLISILTENKSNGITNERTGT